MAIGRESIKRAANASNIGKEAEGALATMSIKDEPTFEKTSKQMISHIKSELPTYLL